MSYLKFNKEELVNLEYSLSKEILSTNRAGSYMSTTIVGCNTRKYHGLFVTPVDAFGGERHVLLSGLDETIVQHDKTFNFGIRKYPGNYYEPKGHKYIVDFEAEPVPTILYRVGGVVLKKEIVFVHNQDTVFIQYTLVEAHSDTRLRLRPFLSFRNAHQLSRKNESANTQGEFIRNGRSYCLYPGFPALYMQLNLRNTFMEEGTWFTDVEYMQEQLRGYDYKDDLYTPGYFEVPIRKGETLVFSASLSEQAPATLKTKCGKEIEGRPDRNNFKNCLLHAADQFIVRRNGATEVIAGYPWFGRWGRDTFISLPGLTLYATNDVKKCKEVLDTMIREMKGGLFPNIGKDLHAAFNSVDAPLWFFWTLQHYEKFTGDAAEIWATYGPAMKAVLRAYKQGVDNIRMESNGLIWASEPGKALTWMDAIVEGIPVTPRRGFPVEINALWYNAVVYALHLARKFQDAVFEKEFATVPALVEANFFHTFWVEERQHLADYVDEFGQNGYTRPNQVIATALDFSPISDFTKAKILEAAQKELLTPKGLRTLAPKDPQYCGNYEGNQATRDCAYHQGTVWPWLIGAYVEGNFKLYGKSFLAKAKWILERFEEDIADYGVGTVPEVYDGDLPYLPGGCISQAWSVAELIRSIRLIEQYEAQ